jgi:5-methylcytosine-specific restriction endonuclease McrA
MKKYRKENREKIGVSTSQWRQANEERVRAANLRRSARWARENATKNRELKRAYNLSTHGKVRAKSYRVANAVRINARSAAWHKANREKARANMENRRVRKLGATGTLSAAERRQTIRDSLGLCVYCNARPERLTLDHIDPLVKGGAHDVNNSAAACHSCNSSKNDTPLLIWLANRALLRRAA